MYFELVSLPHSHLSNRKGRLIFFYDWSVKLKWRGESKTGTACPLLGLHLSLSLSLSLSGNTLDSSATVSGEINIPNFGEENELEEVDVSLLTVHVVHTVGM